jgi:hypothetical protein
VDTDFFLTLIGQARMDACTLRSSTRYSHTLLQPIPNPVLHWQAPYVVVMRSPPWASEHSRERDRPAAAFPPSDLVLAPTQRRPGRRHTVFSCKERYT